MKIPLLSGLFEKRDEAYVIDTTERQEGRSEKAQQQNDDVQIHDLELPHQEYHHGAVSSDRKHLLFVYLYFPADPRTLTHGAVHNADPFDGGALPHTL